MALNLPVPHSPSTRNNWGEQLNAALLQMDGSVEEIKARPQTPQPFDVRSFGAVGNGSTDDTAAINAACAAAKAAGGKVVAHGTFRIDATVYVDCHADLGSAILEYYGPQSGAGVRVGASGVVLYRRQIVLPQIINRGKPAAGSGWSAGGIGIDIYNANSCIVTIPFVQDFAVGVRVYGDGQGNAYNTYQLGWLHNNKRNLLIDSNSTGWSNQNTYVGGRMSVHGSEVPGGSTFVPGGINVQMGGVTHYPNNNTFVGTSFEMAQMEYAVDIQGGGGYNMFLNCRWEEVNAVRFGANAVHNRIIGGYDVNKLITMSKVVTGTGALYNSVEGTSHTQFGSQIMSGLSQIRIGSIWMRDSGGVLQKSTDGTSWTAV